MTEFNRKQRAHLDVMRERLAYLRSEEGDAAYEREPGSFFAGEAHALAWALDLLEGTVTDTDVRIESLARRVRQIEARLGRAEHALQEDEEIDDDDGRIRVA